MCFFSMFLAHVLDDKIMIFLCSYYAMGEIVVFKNDFLGFSVIYIKMLGIMLAWVSMHSIKVSYYLLLSVGNWTYLY